MEGGGEAWIKAGLPTLGSANTAHGAPSAQLRAIRLPDRVAAAELKRMLMDLPGTFEIVDIRPPAGFSDFNIPGSVNVDIADLIENPAYLNGAVPLVIVDRDGSLAMAAGGILSQKTPRSVRVLFGGLDAYWTESTVPPKVSVPALVKPAAPVTTPDAPPARPSVPETKKTKSAGC